MTTRAIVQKAAFLLGVALSIVHLGHAQLPAEGSSNYSLKPTPKTVAWGYYDAKTAPVLRVK